MCIGDLFGCEEVEGCQGAGYRDTGRELLNADTNHTDSGGVVLSKFAVIVNLLIPSNH